MSGEESEGKRISEDTNATFTRSMVESFESFQKARADFVMRVAELSQVEKNSSALIKGGVSELLKPLVLDPVRTVRLNALVALGKLAASSEANAKDISQGETIHQLVFTMNESDDKYCKKASAYVLRAIAKHSPALAAVVVEGGGVEALVNFLTHIDPTIKEAGAWGLDYIARHNAELAQSVVDFQAVPYLIICTQEPELPVKRIAVSVLANICKHTPELAQKIVDADGVRLVSRLLESTDIFLKRQVACFLAQVAKHSHDNALITANHIVIPKILDCLQSVQDSYVLINSCTFVRVVANHGQNFATSLVESGIIEPLIKCISDPRYKSQHAALGAIGAIAVQSEDLALKVRDAGAIPYAVSVLSDYTIQTYIRSEAANCLKNIGSLSAELTHEIGWHKGFTALYDAFNQKDNSPGGSRLKETCRKAFKNLSVNCTELTYLSPLIELDTDPVLLQYILKQCSIVLPTDPEQKILFIRNNKLMILQKLLGKKLPPTIYEFIHSVNGAFPVEAVKYYTPNYEQVLWDTIPSTEEIEEEEENDENDDMILTISGPTSEV